MSEKKEEKESITRIKILYCHPFHLRHNNVHTFLKKPKSNTTGPNSTSWTKAPLPINMSTLQRLTAPDLLLFNDCNLDPLTETYNIGFYLDYLAKWPDLCFVIKSRDGRVEGYRMYLFPFDTTLLSLTLPSTPLTRAAIPTPSCNPIASCHPLHQTHPNAHHIPLQSSANSNPRPPPTARPRTPTTPPPTRTRTTSPGTRTSRRSRSRPRPGGRGTRSG